MLRKPDHSYQNDTDAGVEEKHFLEPGRVAGIIAPRLSASFRHASECKRSVRAGG